MTRPALALLLSLSLTAQAAPPVKRFEPKEAKKKAAKAKKEPAPAKAQRQRPLARPVVLEAEPPAGASEAQAEAPAAPEAGARDALADAGWVAAPGERLAAAWVLSDSAASSMGMAPGDAVLSLGGAGPASAAKAAEALRSAPAGTRLSAVVVRGRSVERLGSPPSDPEVPSARSADRLTPHEKGLAEAHLKQADERAPEILRALRSPSFTVPAGERVWVRFPEGLSKLAEQGDILEARTSTGLTTDSNLDFLAVPHDSAVWFQVLSARDSGPARVLRLQAFKIRLAGGRTYPCSAVVEAVSGSQDLLRVSPGGSVVGAAEEGEALLADETRNFHIRFLEPWTLHEPDAFFPAGPGLWLKSSGTPERRRFEITHVIAERSAAAAGLRVGDQVSAIDGRSSERLSFSEATRALYGRAGSSVELTIEDKGGRRRVRLVRGVLQRKGLGLSWRWEEEGPVVTRVFAGSPAERAGLREGARLLRLGSRTARSLGEPGLRAAFRGDLTGQDALTFQVPGKEPRTAELRRDWVAYPLRQSLEEAEGL